jgi:glycolate oxidase FAD binding subunit
VDLIHPASKSEVIDALRDASAKRTRVLIVGGRRHIDKGNPSEVDAELWTTQLDSVVSYEPAEMVAVVEAGMRIGDLDAMLSAKGQEWPADAPPDATVGGVVAAAANSPRRLRTGPLRDTVLEVEIVTGDGRLIRGGARTVKNVAGYDIPRLAVGSLGTLGVIVALALKLRPLARSRRVLIAPGDLGLAQRVLDSLPSLSGVVVMPGEVQILLEGWPAEVDALTDRALDLERSFRVAGDGLFPDRAPWEDMPEILEAAVPPSFLPDLIPSAAGGTWGALAGVGLLWAGFPADDPSRAEDLRGKAETMGGIAPAIRGSAGLGAAHPAAPDVQRRIKGAFDPHGVLAPGRGWVA